MMFTELLYVSTFLTQFNSTCFKEVIRISQSTHDCVYKLYFTFISNVPLFNDDLLEVVPYFYRTLLHERR